MENKYGFTFSGMQLRSLKGFTLVELLASMALVGVILIIGFQAYQILSALHQRYYQSILYSYELSQAKLQLYQDLHISKSIALSLYDRKACLIPADEDQSICFQFSPDGLIRTTFNRQDTFQIKGNWSTESNKELLVFYDSLMYQRWYLSIPPHSKTLKEKE